MPERSKGHAWKACVRLDRTEGSNPSLSASFYFSKSFCWNFLSFKDASKPQYSWALANFSHATHPYLENPKITNFTPNSPFLLSVSPLHANVGREGTHVAKPSIYLCFGGSLFLTPHFLEYESLCRGWHS